MRRSIFSIFLLATNEYAFAQLRKGHRQLEELPATFLGENLPYPLGACQGECIDDSDCVAGLTCSSRKPGDIVRGCTLSLELLFSSVNFCVLDGAHEAVEEIVPRPPIISPPVNPPVSVPAPVSVPTPVSSPVSVPTPGISSDIDAVYVGNGINSDLPRCHGDCDADANCASGLICLQRSAGDGVPGCRLSLDLAASDFDFCYDPNGSEPVALPVATPTLSPTRGIQAPTLTEAEFIGNGVNNNLGLCQGDCDSDANCADGLICYQRREGDEVPGCILSAELLVSSFDFCTDPSFTFAPTSSPTRTFQPTRSPVTMIIPTAPVPPPVRPPVPSPITVPVPTPVQMPVPVATPVQIPSTPVTMPVTTPSAPVTMPVPVATPIQMPSTPVAMPVFVPTPSSPVTMPVPVAAPVQMPVFLPTPVQAPLPSAPVPSSPVALPTIVFRPTNHPTRPRSIDWSRPTPHPTRPRSIDWPRPTSHPTRARSRDGSSHEPRDAELVSNYHGAHLGLCQADCDNDSQCGHGLICFRRERGDPLPFCILSDELRETNMDFCIPDPNGNTEWGGDEVVETKSESNTEFTAASAPQPDPSQATATSVSAIDGEPFALKLYWEEGYFWQYESYERKWCMGCRSGCTPGNNVAVYNCDISPEMWTLVSFNDGSAQIQNYNWELCLQAVESDGIVLAVCDDSVMEQRFIALGGSFDHHRFEISPMTQPGLCVTQDHHPKMDEVVILQACSKARDDSTSFWNKY